LAQDAVEAVAPGPMGSAKVQKEAGTGAIRNDLGKMFWVPDNEAALEAWNNMVAAQPEIHVFTKAGKKKIRRDMMKVAAAATLHNKHRDKRTGRVKFRGNDQELAGGKYIVDRKTLNALYKKQVAKVGQLKAGFIPSGEWLEAITKKTMSSRKVPAWVRKQAKRMGSKVDGVNKKTGVGFLDLVNEVPYARRAVKSGTINFLERKRQADMDKWAKKRINQVTRTHNARYERAA